MGALVSLSLSTNRDYFQLLKQTIFDVQEPACTEAQWVYLRLLTRLCYSCNDHKRDCDNYAKFMLILNKQINAVGTYKCDMFMIKYSKQLIYLLVTFLYLAKLSLFFKSANQI